MRAVFVQLQCIPGKTYEVADQLFEREVASELYSTSGEYDLLMKIYIEPEVDIGKFINENVANVPGIVRSLTPLPFKAFGPPTRSRQEETPDDHQAARDRQPRRSGQGHPAAGAP